MMESIAGKVLLALSIDGVGQWVLRAVVPFIAVALVVVLIVIQTVALALSGGGHSGPDVQAANTPVSETSSVPLLRTPGPAAASNAGRGSQIIQLAQSWLGVPYQFGGLLATRRRLQLSGLERLRRAGDSSATSCGRPVQCHTADQRPAAR